MREHMIKREYDKQNNLIHIVREHGPTAETSPLQTIYGIDCNTCTYNTQNPCILQHLFHILTRIATMQPYCKIKIPIFAILKNKRTKDAIQKSTFIHTHIIVPVYGSSI